MIQINNLNKKFSENIVLKDLCLDIVKGGIFTILGPNGSGKTTLIKSILGMVIPDSGSITIEDVNIKGNCEYRQRIDYLPQIANFPSNLTLRELLAMIKNLRNKDSDESYLVEEFKLNQYLDKKLGTLSGGTKQKVNIVLTFMFDSSLIILDEPTTGLDPISLIRLKDLIRKESERGKTILITSHVTSFVEEISDQIVFLLEGDIYFRGTINELKEKTGQDDFEYAIAHILKEHNA